MWQLGAIGLDAMDNVWRARLEFSNNIHQRLLRREVKRNDSPNEAPTWQAGFAQLEIPVCNPLARCITLSLTVCGCAHF